MKRSTTQARQTRATRPLIVKLFPKTERLANISNGKGTTSVVPIVGYS